MKPRRWLTLALTLLVTASNLHAVQDVAPLAIPGDWDVDKPSAQGLDAATLEGISKRAEAGDFGKLHSLLVVRGGRLVFERYYRGGDIFQIHTVQSVSKSVTSALVGIAIGDGSIKSVDQPISEFFPEHQDLFASDPRKQHLLLRHVLTMTFGNDWNERAYPYSNPLNIVWKMALSDDWMGFILGRSMIEEPGSHFNYSSGSALLLSGVLQKATGMQAHIFAEKRLFDPLGIPVYGWYRNLTHPSHWSHTGGGVNLRSRDLAKIGFLYANKGAWKGKQVLPASWVEESVKPRVQVDSSLWYGYQWWLQRLPGTTGQPVPDNEVIEGRGWGGQFLVVVPRLNLVVVTTSGSFEDEKEARLALRMAIEQIVPAVKQGASGAGK